jgi:hypothetical protein
MSVHPDTPQMVIDLVSPGSSRTRLRKWKDVGTDEKETITKTSSSTATPLTAINTSLRSSNRTALDSRSILAHITPPPIAGPDAESNLTSTTITAAATTQPLQQPPVRPPSSWGAAAASSSSSSPRRPDYSWMSNNRNATSSPFPLRHKTPLSIKRPVSKPHVEPSVTGVDSAPSNSQKKPPRQSPARRSLLLPPCRSLETVTTTTTSSNNTHKEQQDSQVLRDELIVSPLPQELAAASTTILQGHLPEPSSMHSNTNLVFGDSSIASMAEVVEEEEEEEGNNTRATKPPTHPSSSPRQSRHTQNVPATAPGDGSTRKRSLKYSPGKHGSRKHVAGRHSSSTRISGGEEEEEELHGSSSNIMDLYYTLPEDSDIFSIEPLNPLLSIVSSDDNDKQQHSKKNLNRLVDVFVAGDWLPPVSPGSVQKARFQNKMLLRSLTGSPPAAVPPPPPETLPSDGSNRQRQEPGPEETPDNQDMEPSTTPFKLVERHQQRLTLNTAIGAAVSDRKSNAILDHFFLSLPSDRNHSSVAHRSSFPIEGLPSVPSLDDDSISTLSLEKEREPSERRVASLMVSAAADAAQVKAEEGSDSSDESSKGPTMAQSAANASLAGSLEDSIGMLSLTNNDRVPFERRGAFLGHSMLLAFASADAEQVKAEEGLNSSDETPTCTNVKSIQKEEVEHPGTMDHSNSFIHVATSPMEESISTILVIERNKVFEPTSAFFDGSLVFSSAADTDQVKAEERFDSSEGMMSTTEQSSSCQIELSPSSSKVHSMANKVRASEGSSLCQILRSPRIRGRVSSIARSYEETMPSPGLKIYLSGRRGAQVGGSMAMNAALVAAAEADAEEQPVDWEGSTTNLTFDPAKRMLKISAYAGDDDDESKSRQSCKTIQAQRPSSISDPTTMIDLESEKGPRRQRKVSSVSISDDNDITTAVDSLSERQSASQRGSTSETTAAAAAQAEAPEQQEKRNSSTHRRCCSSSKEDEAARSGQLEDKTKTGKRRSTERRSAIRSSVGSIIPAGLDSVVCLESEKGRRSAARRVSSSSLLVDDLLAAAASASLSDRRGALLGGSTSAIAAAAAAQIEAEEQQEKRNSSTRRLTSSAKSMINTVLDDSIDSMPLEGQTRTGKRRSTERRSAIQSSVGSINPAGLDSVVCLESEKGRRSGVRRVSSSLLLVDDLLAAAASASLSDRRGALLGGSTSAIAAAAAAEVEAEEQQEKRNSSTRRLSSSTKSMLNTVLDEATDSMPLEGQARTSKRRSTKRRSAIRSSVGSINPSGQDSVVCLESEKGHQSGVRRVSSSSLLVDDFVAAAASASSSDRRGALLGGSTSAIAAAAAAEVEAEEQQEKRNSSTHRLSASTKSMLNTILDEVTYCKALEGQARTGKRRSTERRSAIRSSVGSMNTAVDSVVSHESEKGPRSAGQRDSASSLLVDDFVAAAASASLSDRRGALLGGSTSVIAAAAAAQVEAEEQQEKRNSATHRLAASTNAILNTELDEAIDSKPLEGQARTGKRHSTERRSAIRSSVGSINPASLDSIVYLESEKGRRSAGQRVSASSLLVDDILAANASASSSDRRGALLGGSTSAIATAAATQVKAEEQQEKRNSSTRRVTSSTKSTLNAVLDEATDSMPLPLEGQARTGKRRSTERRSAIRSSVGSINPAGQDSVVCLESEKGRRSAARRVSASSLLVDEFVAAATSASSSDRRGALLGGSTSAIAAAAAAEVEAEERQEKRNSSTHRLSSSTKSMLKTVLDEATDSMPLEGQARTGKRRSTERRSAIRSSVGSINPAGQDAVVCHESEKGRGSAGHRVSASSLSVDDLLAAAASASLSDRRGALVGSSTSAMAAAAVAQLEEEDRQDKLHRSTHSRQSTLSEKATIPYVLDGRMEAKTKSGKRRSTKIRIGILSSLLGSDDPAQPIVRREKRSRNKQGLSSSGRTAEAVLPQQTAVLSRGKSTDTADQDGQHNERKRSSKKRVSDTGKTSVDAHPISEVIVCLDESHSNDSRQFVRRGALLGSSTSALERRLQTRSSSSSRGSTSLSSGRSEKRYSSGSLTMAELNHEWEKERLDGRRSDDGEQSSEFMSTSSPTIDKTIAFSKESKFPRSPFTKKRKPLFRGSASSSIASPQKKKQQKHRSSPTTIPGGDPNEGPETSSSSFRHNETNPHSAWLSGSFSHLLKSPQQRQQRRRSSSYLASIVDVFQQQRDRHSRKSHILSSLEQQCQEEGDDGKIDAAI